MPDMTVNVNSVAPSVNAAIAEGVFGETVTAGQTVYFKEADRKYYKADSNVTTAEANVRGIALNGGAAGQLAMIQTAGNIILGTDVLGGQFYIQSETAGGMQPVGDQGTGEILTFIGYGASNTTLTILLLATGVTKA